MTQWQYFLKYILIYTSLIIGKMSLFCIFLVFGDFFFLPFLICSLLSHWVVFLFLIDLCDFLRCLHINSSSVICNDWDLKMPCTKHFKGHQVKKLLSEIISEPFPDALGSCLLVSALSVQIWTSNYTLTSSLFSDGALPWTPGSPASQSDPHLPASELRDHGLCLLKRRTTDALSSVCLTQASPPIGK